MLGFVSVGTCLHRLLVLVSGALGCNFQAVPSLWGPLQRLLRGFGPQEAYNGVQPRVS